MAGWGGVTVRHVRVVVAPFSSDISPSSWELGRGRGDECERNENVVQHSYGFCFNAQGPPYLDVVLVD